MGVRLERPDDLAIQSSTGGFSRALPGRRLGPTANALQRCCKTDHTSHLAVYLSNLDGNGIELAWDRAPEDWTFLIDGNLTAETLRGHEKRLDVAALIAEVNEAPAEPEPAIA